MRSAGSTSAHRSWRRWVRYRRGSALWSCLRYFADLTEAQAASALGCSVGTVKSQTARALARLRTSPALTGVLSEEVAP